MIKLFAFSIAAALAFAAACVMTGSTTSSANAGTELPVITEPMPAETKGTQTAVFAGGCFWGVEAVFEHVKGVIDVRSGYAGGTARTAKYDLVSEGDTGHAESVRVTFDPAKISYVQLLTIFFSVAHDPTELNRQGPDVGTQYRSAIFYNDDSQKKLALDYIDAINKSQALPKPVVTEVTKLGAFFEAEAYHQNYLQRHPDQPYIVINDMPKLAALKEKFPELYIERK